MQPHVVELNEASRAFLEQALETSPDKPFPFNYWYIIKLWAAAREAAGYPALRIHDLRHSFVSNQLAAGTPIHVVRDTAAHRSRSVTALYAHNTDEARRAAAQRVQIEVGAKAEPARRTGHSDTSFDTNRGADSRKSAEELVGHLGFEPRANGLRRQDPPPQASETTGFSEDRAIDDRSKSAPNDARGQSVANGDPVEVALADALTRAAAAEQWATVETLSRELQARREARAGVVQLDAARKRRDGGAS